MTAYSRNMFAVSPAQQRPGLHKLSVRVDNIWLLVLLTSAGLCAIWDTTDKCVTGSARLPSVANCLPILQHEPWRGVDDQYLPERSSVNGLERRVDSQGWLGVPDPTLQLRRLGLAFSSLKDSPVWQQHRQACCSPAEEHETTFNVMPMQVASAGQTRR